MFIVKCEFIVLGLTRDAFHFLYQDPENPLFITCFLMDLFAYFLFFFVLNFIHFINPFRGVIPGSSFIVLDESMSIFTLANCLPNFLRSCDRNDKEEG